MKLPSRCDVFACFKELFSQHCEHFWMPLPLWTPCPSMQREALPDAAVKPDVEAEPKDQLETISMCFKQSDFYSLFNP